MNGEYLLYLQEIKDTEWVIELISEQFDDAMNMMTPNSVIYGGAVRDCLAGKDLIGDLDIAVSESECTTMINKFVKNPKWVNVSNKGSGTHYKKFGSAPTLFGLPPRRGTSPRTPQIMTFKTLGNKTVQIIILSPTEDDPFQTVTTMVKQVDIVCCGVILTNDNKVFEVVPNAYKDCKKHVLHLNNMDYVKDIDSFKQRIEKLSERGWINEINIDKVIRTVNRRRKQNLENKKGVARISKHATIDFETHTHNIENSNFVDQLDQGTIMEQGCIILREPYTLQEGATGSEIKFSYAEGTEVLTHTGYRSTLSSSDIGSIGGLSDALHALEIVAKKYRLDIIVQPIKNYLMVVTKNKYVSNQVHTRVMGKAKIPAMPPLVNKGLDGVAHMYSKTTNPPMKKKKYKLRGANNITMSYDSPEAATMTYGELDEQIPEEVRPPRPPISSIGKQTLGGLNKFSKSRPTRVERYFNYSTDLKLKDVTDNIDRNYREMPKGDVIRIGGISMVLSRLERIAKRHKLDIGIIMDKGTTTIITRGYYISNHIYNLLIDVNNAALNAFSSGGDV